MLGLAAAHFFAGHFNDTVALTERILGEVPTHNVARRYRAAALAHLGRIDEANAVIADLLRRNQAPTFEAPEALPFATLAWVNSTFQAWKRPACRNESGLI